MYKRESNILILKMIKKNSALYQKVTGLIEYNFEELNILLESMASKCFKINQINTNIISGNRNQKMKYRYFSFIKDDCDKCRKTIFTIFSMIPKDWDKIEADYLIQGIIDANEEVPLEKETKKNLTSSIPDHIYGKENQLVHIPTQSLIQFKQFEDKIKNNCKIIETFAEVSLSWWEKNISYKYK